MNKKETLVLRGREEVEKFYREWIAPDIAEEHELKEMVDGALKYPDGAVFGHHYFPKNYQEGQPHKVVKLQVFHTQSNQ